MATKLFNILADEPVCKKTSDFNFALPLKYQSPAFNEASLPDGAPHVFSPEGVVKHFRTINAYSDETKAMYGPLFKQIENLFFGNQNPLHKWFVKKIPVRDRPQYLFSLFGLNPTTIGDFSAMECHHRGELARAVNYVINKLLPANCDPLFRKCVNEHMLTFNETYFRSTGLRVQVPQTLMSGAVWTSLANCILSSFLVCYMRLRDRYPTVSPKVLASHWTEITLVAEGDDTLSMGGDYNPEIIAALGLNLKSKGYPWYGAGDFCGITKSQNVDDVVTDPVKVLCNFFTLDLAQSAMRPSKQDGFMRAKALSYYYQYSSCPVISSLAWAVLYRTRHLHAMTGRLDYWRTIVLEEALASGEKFYLVPPNIHPDTRHTFEKMYNIGSVAQRELEQHFNAWAMGYSGDIPVPDVFTPYKLWYNEHSHAMPKRIYPPWNPLYLPDPSILKPRVPFNLNAFLSLYSDNPTPELVYRDEDGRPHQFKKFDRTPRPFLDHPGYMRYRKF